MLIRHPADIAPSEITPRALYADRRRLLLGAGALALTGTSSVATAQTREKIPGLNPAAPAFTTTETLNTGEQITSYNNF